MSQELRLNLLANDVINGFSFSFCETLVDYLTTIGEVGWFKDEQEYEKALDGLNSGSDPRITNKVAIVAFDYLGDQMHSNADDSFMHSRELLKTTKKFLAIFEKEDPNRPKHLDLT